MISHTKKLIPLLLLTIFTFGATARVPENWTEDSVFILPDMGRKPWIEAIENADDSIDMAGYKISDEKMIQTLKQAANRGVKINIIIEPDNFEHSASANIKSPIEQLRSFAKVVTLSDRFNQAHSKMIVVDKKFGLISTGNLDAESFDGIPEKNIAAARDFAVPILDQNQIDEMLRVFEADITDQRVTPQLGPLVYGPDHQRSTFLNLFNKAKHKADVYQQSFQDEGIAKAAAGAAKANVKVRVLMMPFPFGKDKDANIPNQMIMRKAGVDIGLNDKLYIHAKVVIIDDKEMYLGSGNFYTPALDQTRELGILITNPQQIKAVKDQFEQDWRQCTVNLERHVDDKQ